MHPTSIEMADQTWKEVREKEFKYYWRTSLVTTFKVKDFLLSQAIDKDGSGFIDAGELGRMGGKMDGDKARALMTKLDKDGDGKINLQEFRTLFKQWSNSTQQALSIPTSVNPQPVLEFLNNLWVLGTE